MTGTDYADLKFVLLAVLCYFPDRLARQYAEQQLDEVRHGRSPDVKLLKRIVMLIDANPNAAQHADVWRAMDVIKKAST